MADPAFDATVRDAVREALAQLLPELLGQHAPAAPAGGGLDGGLAPGAHAAVPVNAPAAPPPSRAVAPLDPAVPLVPAPPVAAVHRPSQHPAVLAPVVRREPALPSSPAPRPAAPRPVAPAHAQGIAPVPGVPIAAVHRPGGSQPMGSAPAHASELLARGPAPASAALSSPAPRGRSGAVGARVEEVSLDTDDDLDAFVRQLLRLYENPRDRMLVKSGKLRFALRRGGRSAGGGAVHHVEKGAVTERHVREAAAAGARLVLGRRAVLTPMARDRARAAGVAIEKEA